MESSSLNLHSFIFLIFILLSTLKFVHPGNINGGKLYEVCPTNSNFAPNSSFGYNLNNLYLSLTLYNPPVENGFFNLSYGEKSDQVNAIGLCRRDVTSYVCGSCITEAVALLTDICPDQTEAIVWYDECMFRYSNRSIFGKMEFEPSHLLTKPNKGSRVTKSDNKVLTTLLDNLITQAASGDSFATGEASASKNETIYGLAQCTPDLSGVACKDCLSKAAQSLLRGGMESGSFLTPSCIIRYDNHVFYDLSVKLPPPNLSPESPPSNPPVLPPGAAPALPPNKPSPSPLSPPIDAPPPSPSVDEPPSPAVFDELPPPVPPPVEELPPPPSEFEAPLPPPPQLAPELEPIVDYPDDFGIGNMNSKFQALGTVIPLVILQLFAF